MHRPLALPYLFIAPAVGLTVLFSLVPLVMLAYRSLYGGAGIFATSLQFVGLQNYGNAVSQGGGKALEVTAIYTVAFVVGSMALGLGIALLLNIKLPGLDFLRAPFVIPLVVPTVATALIWANIFAPQFGFVNRILEGLGLPQADFTSSPSLAPVSTALSYNDGGIGLSRSRWPLVWFKGGSEPGVLSLGFLARRADGTVAVVTVLLSDPAKAIAPEVTLKALADVHGAFGLVPPG